MKMYRDAQNGAEEGRILSERRRGGIFVESRSKSLFENYEGCCFRGKGRKARRDEGDCFARQRTTILRETE